MKHLINEAIECAVSLDDYEFENEAGYLLNAVPWIRLKEILREMQSMKEVEE